jgi:hypothetical protein
MNLLNFFFFGDVGPKKFLGMPLHFGVARLGMVVEVGS